MKSLRCCSLLEYTFSIFLVILLVGCKKGEMPESERKESIETVLSSAGELPREAIRAFKSKETTKDVLRSGKPIVEYKDKSSPDVIESGIYRLVQRTLSLSGYELEKDYKTNLAPEVVWPGNIIYARSVELPNLAGIPELNKYRTPGKVTMAVLNGSSSLTREITSYRYSEINRVLNELVASNKDALPANFTYSLHTVQTIGEAAYYLNIPKDELMRDDRYKIFRKINWSNGHYKSVLTFSQDLFTLVYDDPENGPASLFNSQLSPDLLSRFSSVGNPLAYISSVTYGRRCVAIIEETERTYRDKSEQEAVLEHNLSYGNTITREGGKSGHGGRHPQWNKAKNLKIYLHLVGGKDIFSSDVSLNPTMAELQRFLISTADGKSKNYGVPVSCTIKYLHGLKPLSVPHKADGVYSFNEYIPEVDNNEMSLSDMKVECLVSTSYHSLSSGEDPKYHKECIIDNIEVHYNVDNAEKTEILLKDHKEILPPRREEDFDPNTSTYTLFSLPVKGLAMPPFGVAPKGYIQLSITAHTVEYWRENLGDWRYPKWEDRVSTSQPYRRVLYFRFNPKTATWYLDTKMPNPENPDYYLDKIVDDPFKSLVVRGRLPKLGPFIPAPFAIRLRYTLATKLRGALPHTTAR